MFTWWLRDKATARRLGSRRGIARRSNERRVPRSLLYPLVALTSLSGCGQKDVSRRYEFVVRVTSDPDQPLSGVGVVHRGKHVGVSSADGSVKLSARGNEGETLSFDLRCPEGYRGPSTPLAIPPRTSADSSRRPEYAATCSPTTRTLVIAVRAEYGENLPVRYLGREVARTDRSGAAHLLLKIAPEDALELTLDTSEQPGASSEESRPAPHCGSY